MKTSDLKFLLLFTVILYSVKFAVAQSVNVYNLWDFENNTIGKYTDDMIGKDFDVVTLYSHNSADIVLDEINGMETRVLRITHAANKTSVGFDLDARIAEDFDEVYLTYNIKFSNEFNSTTGGKLPGLGGFPVVTANQVPRRDQGFLCKLLFKQSGRIFTYHYDRTPPAYPHYSPWSSENYRFSKIFITNGTWYNITQQLKMNSFTNGRPNKDGVNEIWINGRLLYQENNLVLMELESDSLKIDDLNIAHFYGGSSVSSAPIRECYGYINNIIIWKPMDEQIKGFDLHNPRDILKTPFKITERKFYYDVLRTTPGPLNNSEFGSTYSPCINETYLIDAGEGKTISFKLIAGKLGRGDNLFIYDGNTTDAPLIQIINENTYSVQDLWKSTGRYMFLRFSTDTDPGSEGWTGTLSFIPSE